MDLKNNRILRTLYYYWKNYETKHSYNYGKGNRIKNNGIRIASRIQFRGNNNVVIIDKGAALLNCTIRITGNDCIVFLNKNCYVTEVEIFVENNNCMVEIGNKTFIGRQTHIACTEDNSQIIIGGEGMISSYCQIRTGDSHSILDLDGNRINSAASVRIGQHCWLGEGCKVLKGVILGDNCIVSTGAIVTKSYGSNVLIGGVPAKIVKENINWNEIRL